MTLYFLCVGCSHQNRKKNQETSYGERENKMFFMCGHTVDEAELLSRKKKKKSHKS